MNREDLFQQIIKKRSYLCVGLDTDINKIPQFLRKEKDPVFEFNRRIIDETVDYCVAYKPNIAFYEALGSYGLEALQKTIEYIPDEVFTIADAKRGDIGNTSRMYAKAFFETMGFDSITLSPYMGFDSLEPYLEYPDKWIIVLALTSNPGSMDYQKLKVGDKYLYQEVIKKTPKSEDYNRVMFVVGATQGENIAEVRQTAPENFFLVPGVGAQGGDLQEVSKYGLNKKCGLLVNSSRGIIYASNDQDFDRNAGIKAQKIALDMDKYLDQYM